MSEKYNGSKNVAVSLFLQSLRKQKVSGSTLKGYATDLQAFFDHLHLKSPARRSDNEVGNPWDKGGDSLDVSTLERVQPRDIESYLKSLAEKGLKFSTVKRNVAAIRRFFGFLVDQEIITNDPAKSLTVRPVANSALTFEQIASLFEYLAQHQQMGNESDIIRYRRDEVILILMILYGVRQYQLGGLKLSQLQKTGKELSLTVKKGFTIRIEPVVLEKLRAYLSIRKSNADTVFLEPLRKKPVDHSSMRAVLTELSYAIRVECSPRSLYDTHLQLEQNPEERQKFLEQIGSENLKRTYGAMSNA